MAPEVRLIDDDGKHVGLVKTTEALSLAREKNLDLVEISGSAKPPIAKILDFGQFLYEQRKKEQKARAKVKKSETKGIRLSLRISKNDLEIRIRQAKKFLEKGHKIKIEMKLMGREKQHFSLAHEIINKFIDNLGADVIIDQPLNQQGGRLSVIVRKK